MTAAAALFAAALVIAAGCKMDDKEVAAAQLRPPRVLVFSATAGYRHDSIAQGVALIQQLGDQNGFTVDAAEDPGRISAEGLADIASVVFLHTTGDVLTGAQQKALRAYVEGGGGWVGVHAAADAEYDWQWYGTLLGGDAWFASHPAFQSAVVNVQTTSHPATKNLPASSIFTDEWYNFANDPSPAVIVLLSLDESSYSAGGGAMGASHPIAWYHGIGQGRAFYTGLGHAASTFADPRFQAHLLGGVQWAGNLSQ